MIFDKTDNSFSSIACFISFIESSEAFVCSFEYISIWFLPLFLALYKDISASLNASEKVLES